ncbi:hypothetical protein PybrP1_009178 [[Pythium] brassicae (nom. inval.)]|nr:hypothetical protein PybrP1_009178 [[Pythium] brassicae (nom. inval.)]
MADDAPPPPPPPPPVAQAPPAAPASAPPATPASRGASRSRRSNRRRPQASLSAAAGDAAAASKAPTSRAKNTKQAPPSAAAADSPNARAETPPSLATPTPVEALVHAIRRDNLDAFRAVLAAHPALDVNTQRTRDGDAALVEACRYARREMASVLLREQRASVNVASTNKRANRGGLSPLVAACMTLDAALVELLLRAATSPAPALLLHMFGRVNAVVACVLFSVPNGYSAAQAERGAALLATLLSHAQAHGALPEIFAFETEKGNQLVHIVAGLANWRALAVLRAFGADVSAVNRAGKAPLSMVETNAFERRSIAHFAPAKHEPKKKRGAKPPLKKRGGGGGGGEAAAAGKTGDAVGDIEGVMGSGEPMSEADVQTKLPATKVDRKVEVDDVMRSYMELSKAVAVLIDGLVYAMVFIYSLSLKHGKEYPSLWKSALNSKHRVAGLSLTSAGAAEDVATPIRLSPGAFKLIMDDILANRSLSRRVQTMAMVLMHLEAPYVADKPLPADATLAQASMGDLAFYRGVTTRLYRSGVKLLFGIFDRTDIEDDESYDEEIEFHLLIALTELPVKKLWPLLEVGLHAIDDPVASPQRFSLLMHVVQVFEQVEASLVADEGGTLAKLFKILKQFVKGEAAKKRFERNTSANVHLLKAIATALPVPPSFVAKVYALKDKIDVLIRSDPKIVGVDLYALAPLQDVIRLEHKVDYLGALAEEQHRSVSVSINRASAANHVDFILQQVLSTPARNLKGELNVTLINEPGVGVGVTREFFHIVQQCFFSPRSTGGAGRKGNTVPLHVAEIGAQWLDLARAESPSRGVGNRSASHTLGSDPSSLFPLFEVADAAQSDDVRITARRVVVRRSVMAAKVRAKQLSLSLDDVVVDTAESASLKRLYLCAGRLMGLAIRNHQSLNVSFPLALWKFFAFEKVAWHEYCGANEVFKRSLQFVLDHDFDAAPLDMHFEFTTDVSVLDDDDGDGDGRTATATATTTTTMELQLKGNSRAHAVVTNQNKHEYVELRAQQHLFGNEFEYYKKMRDGLLEAVPRADLKLFRPDELRRLVRGARVVDVAGMKRAVLYSKGASLEHGVIRMFWEVAEGFDQAQLELLLTFWSGSPQPPLFGFESTHRSLSSDAAVWYIDVDPRSKPTHCPMANTCDRRLILPEYPSAQVLREKLCVALKHGAVGYDRM